MKGNWIFFGLASFLGVLCSLENGVLYLAIFLVYVYFLKRVRGFSIKYLTLVFLVFILFFVQSKVLDTNNQTVLTGREKNLSLLLQPPFKLDGNYFSAYGKEGKSGEKVVIQYRIPTIEEKNKLMMIPVGSLCRVKGELKEPEPSRNAGAFNYKEYLYHERIFWTMSVEQFDINHCTKKNTLLTFIQRLRQAGIAYIHSHFPPETAPLTAALIFGDRSTIEPDIISAYQTLGIVHLLAISGLHVGMLMGLLFYMGLRIGITREKMTTILILFLPLYIILTGASPSVIRACFMMMLALMFMKLKKRNRSPIDILSLVFIIYIFVNPYVIYNVGFQLSFAVTFALVLSASFVITYVQRPISILFITSLIAQFASIPILLFHFYEFSIISVVVNIFYIPLYSVVMLPVLLSVFILSLFLGDIMNPIFHFLEFNLRLLNQTTMLLSSFPFNTLSLGRPPTFVLFLYFLGIPFCFYLWEKAKNRKQFILSFFTVLSLLLVHFSTVNLSIFGEVTIIDVGQGDSILIKLPLNRGVYLIDTGGTIQFPREEWMERKDPFEVGKDLLVPYLKSQGITRLDHLILTHGDLDHVGGAAAVLREIDVENVIFPTVEEHSSLEKEIMRICKEKEITVQFGKRGDKWSEKEYSFHILSPSPADRLERNDQSIALYVHLGGLRWLFTGDLEEEGERSLLNAYPNLEVDVLKVGHHGSKTSTSELLLDQLKPKIALISAGKENRFGHPHEEVLTRLEDRQISIFRTDKDGAITFLFRGERGTFSTEIHMIKQRPFNN